IILFHNNHLLDLNESDNDCTVSNFEPVRCQLRPVGKRSSMPLEYRFFHPSRRLARKFVKISDLLAGWIEHSALGLSYI
ncbi:MAG: hypothetical protein ACRESZ_04525, partial [Methylococcales bacterium]